MAESFPSAVRGRWRPGPEFLFRAGRRTVVESLYLLTAPVIAAAGLLLVLGGLCVGTVLSLLPGGARAVAGALAPVRWFADLERWRIAAVRRPAAGAQGASERPGPKGKVSASDPELWLGVAHAVVVFPVALVTSVVTALWWFVGLGAATSALRGQFTSAGSMRPMTLYAGSARDQDTYRGPFGRRTSAPVLVIGNKWDPVTSYGNAVKVAHMLPDSRLVASDSWGHEAVGTSACVDKAVFGYLIHPLATAPKITRCRGNVQPFAPSPSAH